MSIEDDDVATLSGPQAVPLVTIAELTNRALVRFLLDTPAGNTRSANADLFLQALGAIAFFGTDGDVHGEGVLGQFLLTIGDGKVTYSKIQNMPPNSLLGRSGGTGPPSPKYIGGGLSITGDTITADAANQQQPTAALAVYHSVPGAL